MPSVLPSREKEWQLAHVCMPVSSSRLRASATLRSRQAMSGTLAVARGVMTPFSPAEGMSGTSR